MARVCSVAQNLIAAGKHYLLESAQVWRGGRGQVNVWEFHGAKHRSGAAVWR